MVLGLGGTALPPRPAKRHMPGGSAPTAAPAPESSLARVHSNSHLAAALTAAGTHTVDTPSAEQQPALPAASGQSNVRSGNAWRVHEEVQQQMALVQRQQEQSASECDQPSPLAPRLQQALLQQQAQQAVLQQQAHQQQQGPAEPPPAQQGCGEGPPSQLHQHGQQQREQQQPALQAGRQQEQHLAPDASLAAAAQQQEQPQSVANQTEQPELQQSAPDQAHQQQQQRQDATPHAEPTAEETAVGGRKRRAEQPPPGGAQGGRARRSRLAAAEAAAAEAAAAPAGGSAGDAGAAGGRRGSRRLAAAGAGSTPPAKRQKPAGSAASRGVSGASGGTKAAGARGPAGRSKFADVLHRVVAVPGSIFYVDTPGKFFYGQVTKSEPKRKVAAVEVLFFDDDSKYWFPVAEVRRWMAEMAAAAPHQPHAWARHNPGAPPPPQGEAQEEMDEEAAKVLQSLSVSIGGSQMTSSQAERAGQQPAVSSGGKGGRRASTAARGGSRERPAPRGGRPGSAGAAAGKPLRRTDSQERREGALMAAVQAESR